MKDVKYVQDYWTAKKQQKEQIKYITLFALYGAAVTMITYAFCELLFTTL